MISIPSRLVHYLLGAAARITCRRFLDHRIHLDCMKLFLIPFALVAFSTITECAEPSLFSVAFENDFFAGSDANYTHGTKFTYLHREDENLYDSVKSGLDFAPLGLGGEDPVYGRVSHKRWGVTLGQNLYTPEDLSTSALIVNDRPYAGWLYGGLILQRRGSSWTVPTADHFELNLGVVGPAAAGGPVQKLVHDIGNFGKPEGWRNQIKNEPVVMIQANRAWLVDLLKGSENRYGGRFRLDLIPEAGFGLGNLTTYANAGLMFRTGINLPEYFNPSTGSGGIRPSFVGGHATTLSDNGRENPKFGFYVFGGAFGRAVARNIFLDGNTFANSHSVDKRTFLADFRLGASLTMWRRHTVMFWHAYRSREFIGQRIPQRFAGVSYSYAF